GRIDGVRFGVSATQRAEVRHLAPGVEKCSTGAEGVRVAHDKPVIIDRAREAVVATERAKVRHRRSGDEKSVHVDVVYIPRVPGNLSTGIDRKRETVGAPERAEVGGGTGFVAKCVCPAITCEFRGSDYASIRAQRKRRAGDTARRGQAG